MNIALDYDIFEWLDSWQLLKVTKGTVLLSGGKMSLDETATTNLLNGTIFAKILQKVIETTSSKSLDKSMTIQTSVDSLKTVTNASSNLYNWSVVCDTLKKLNIDIDPDVKNLIVAGDTDMIKDLLRELYYKVKKIGDSKKITKGKSESMINYSKSPVQASALIHSTFRQNKEKEQREIIDLDKVNVEKQLSQTQTLLEFFLVSVARSMNLSARQTVQMLSNNHKYLAHVVVKGVKEEFDSIIAWMNDLNLHANYLVSLMAKDDDKKHAMVFVHHALKAGFISKDSDVAQITCTLFQTLAYEYLNQHLLEYAWEWFISDQGGLQYVLNCIKRHPDMAESAISVILEFGKFNLIELFSQQLKRFHPDTKEYLITVRGLLKPLSESLSTEELMSSGIVDVWIDFAMKEIEENPSVEVRLMALCLICDVWLDYPSKIEGNEITANNLVSILKKMTREPSRAVKITVITQMFRLLESFASTKDPYAPIIYKTLTFCIIENFNDPQIREYLFHNFKSLFKATDNIPIGIVIEPLVKQLQVSDVSSQTLNLFDLEFLTSAAQNPKLSLKHGIQLLDILAKIYLNNIVFAYIAGKGLLQIIDSNIDSEAIQEYVLKFIKIALAILFTSEKNKKPKDKMIARYGTKGINVKQVISATELETEVLNAQKRALIIEMIKNIIDLGNSDVNNRAKTLLLHTHHQLMETLRIEQKGILMLLSLFGNVNEIIANFEQELAIEAKINALRKNSPEKSFGGSDEEEKSHESPKKLDSEANEVFQGLGIGPKKKVNLEKSAVTELALLRKPRADPKVVKGLEEIRKNFSEKQLRIREKEEMEKVKYEHLKKKLKTTIDKRMIELGVPFQGKNHVIENVIFDEGSREAEKIMEKKSGLPEINIVHLENEEDRDREGVEVVMRKYQKIIKHFFSDYSNSGFSGKEVVTFNKMEKKLELISLAEAWKILKDHDLSDLLTYPEFTALMRLTNIEVMSNDMNLKWLTFDGFKNFLIQLAIFIFSRPPHDLSSLPVFCPLNEFFLRCRDAEAKRGKNTVLYDNPDATDIGDPELNRHLNEILKKDPNYPVPEAYKKVQEPDIEFSYNFAPSLEIPDKFRMAYELVDDLVFNALGIHVIEPMSSYTTITKAKLKLTVQTLPKMYSIEPFVHKTPEELPKDYLTRFQNDPKNSPMKTNPLYLGPVISLPLVMKHEIAKQPFKYRPLYAEVGLVLDDICNAVAQGKPYAEPVQPITNRAIEDRIKQREKEVQEWEESERKRNDRRQFLHGRLKVLTKEKEEQEMKQQEEKKKPPPPNKKELEWVRYHEEQKEKIKEHKEKVAAEKEALEEKEKEKKWKEREIKKKRFQDFNSKKIGELYKQIDKIKDYKSDMEKEKKITEKKKTKKEKDFKTKRLQDLKEEIVQYEKFKKDDEEIHNLVQKKEIQDVFQKYEKQLKQVYNWYCLSTHHAIGSLDQIDSMLFKPYQAFASEFLIFPTIISWRDVELVFRSLTKVKPIIDGKQVSLTYEDFEEALIRIAIKGREIFDQIYSARVNKGTDMINKALVDMERNQNKKPEEGDENKPDEYEKINDTTANTVQGMFYYLDLPADKQALYNKLHELKTRVFSLHEKKQRWKKILLSSTMAEVQPQNTNASMTQSPVKEQETVENQNENQE